jgi:cytoskeleton protein RodZ
MEKMGFGEILRQTRERKGLDLGATARRLRIRPDILQAIEDGNFAAMPPRGYTRNMVNGYARYLGLNSTDITGMYLDELYAYQVGATSSRTRSSGIDMSDAPNNTRLPRRSGTGSHSNRQGRSAQHPAQPSRNRKNPDKRQSESSKLRWPGDGMGADTLRRDANARSGGRVYAQNHMHQARGSMMPDTRYTNLYSGPADHQTRHSKLPFIVAAIVILVIVVVICVALFGGKAKESSGTVTNVPVTGLSDSSTKSDDANTSSSQSTTATAPTKSTFSYDVAQGSTSWIEVYVDGTQQIAESVVGPSTKSFDFAGTLEFICANPTGVTATLDGTAVTLTSNSNGVVDATYDFKDILAQWNEAHSSGTSTASGASTTAASA